MVWLYDDYIKETDRSWSFFRDIATGEIFCIVSKRTTAVAAN